MNDLDLITTLTGGLAAALVCGYAAFRLGLSPIVGYLIAGLVVGPYTPGFVADRHIAEELAEIGVILLMFGVGLEFHVEELLAVRRVALPGAVGRSLATAAVGAAAAVAFGWSLSTGIVFGLAISVASTVVLTRVLSDAGDLKTPAGHLAMGWLVVEDLFAVLVVVLLPPLFEPGVGAAGVARAAAVALVKVALMIAATFVLGKRFIPWVMERVAATRSRELFTLTVLVVALGVAVGSVKLFGVSMALGAFLAGMVVGRTEFGLRAATEALPMRDAFAVLFFVSVGILFHPSFLLESPGLVAATLALVVVVKPALAVGFALALGCPLRKGLAVALATAQIGEFSFILAGAGQRLGVFDEHATDALIAAAIVSITSAPFLYRLVGPLEKWFGRTPEPSAPIALAESPGPRAVIVGHGPVGRALTRVLREHGVEPVVIELNVATARDLARDGTTALHGDAARPATLESAGVADAFALILSASGVPGASGAVRHAKFANPSILVMARAEYLRDAAELREAGADEVFSGEGEVALAMTEALLRKLGAPSERIEADRRRVRADLAGDAASDDAG